MSRLSILFLVVLSIDPMSGICYYSAMHNMQGQNKVTVHTATGADADALLALIDALADYEKLTPPDAQGKLRLISDMTGSRPRFHALIAEYEGHPVGYSIFLDSYASFAALPKLYIEDIFVLPGYRSKGVGYTLFRAMVQEAVRQGCGSMEWTVLDWNQLAIDFYTRLGALPMKEWELFRLKRNEMEQILRSGDSVHTSR